MDYTLEIPVGATPVGYQWLEREFQLQPLPHHVQSYISPKAERQKIVGDGVILIIYPNRTTVEENWLAHLEFACKNEGIHLNLLRQLFPKVEPALLVEALQKRPSGKYLRKIWYLYEELSGQKILVDSLKQGNYVDLLDPKYYHTSFRYLVKRQRINQNLLGDIGFCGIVRKTASIAKFEKENLAEKCRKTIQGYDPKMFDRAMNYLYRKETKSSFAIENETPDQRRSGKFVALLKGAASGSFYSRKSLTNLQNLIVDSRFANSGYRDEDSEQIYVGQAVGLGKELVHFAGPKPEDTPDLMESWSRMARALSETEDLHPVLTAAVVAFGFVFIHPFSDGNGRIHRFLIHHVLAKRGFAPENVIFPVSAVMLKRQQDYDVSLESFSTPLMEKVEYELDNTGRMTIFNETIDYYRSIDYTLIAETLFDFVSDTIENEIPEEFSFLENYDRARLEMQAVVDLPDRVADFFIRLLLQNHGELSKKKRKLTEFEKLTDEEISDLEGIVSKTFTIT